MKLAVNLTKTQQHTLKKKLRFSKKGLLIRGHFDVVKVENVSQFPILADTN
jgi:arginine utilization protein RocB